MPCTVGRSNPGSTFPQGVILEPPATRLGEPVLGFTDPHGLRIALTETSDRREFTPWELPTLLPPTAFPSSPVPYSSWRPGLNDV